MGKGSESQYSVSQLHFNPVLGRALLICVLGKGSYSRICNLLYSWLVRFTCMNLGETDIYLRVPATEVITQRYSINTDKEIGSEM